MTVYKGHFLTVIFIFFSLSTSLFSQNRTLSKHEMSQDLDSLYTIVTKYCSFLPLLEERTNISVKEEFDLLRKELPTTETTFDFTNLVRRHLNILNDGHTTLTNKSSVKWFTEESYLKSVSNITLLDTLYADYYHTIISDSIFPLIKSGLRTKYIDGKYYNVRPFYYNGIKINSGEEIKSINKVSINKFVSNYYDQMFFLMWDTNNRQWYSDYFTLSLPFLKQDIYTLRVGNKDILINSNNTLINLEKEKYSLHSAPQVSIIDNNILYIYMPMMMDKERYINEIIKKYNGNIDNIIFDLRGNGGGDDSVWSSILSMIIKEPLSYDYKVGMINDKILEKAISNFGEISIQNDHMTVYKNRTIHPHRNSINFTGPIFIIQDKYTFSAASAFVSCALQNEPRFTIIGERSSLISGYTFPPIVFKLSNSGIAFKLGFSFDKTGGVTNRYMDKVDVEIKENITDYIEKLYEYDSHSMWYLENKDKCISYVKELSF